ncbi:DUF3326 domain-containing protein [Cylindrospermopsis raciborskii]|uniref:DUF3326 domain-containing protein n=1 Tax=Cylindrospermopsis raciborskii CENA302 TaxID=1170768 RepID=A0A9Q5W973_9CYAN|nr:DUF3326 domain-containing protein [Cylindrospermopsis raciborskii]OPH09508.1 hypothetical protein CENA302_10280 [Cylindrospermopsis raciborskii CENA302]
MSCRITTKDFEVQYSPKRFVWSEIASSIGNLGLPGDPIRLILTARKENTIIFEGSFLETDKQPVWPSLLNIRPRQISSAKPFVAVSIVPTGVRAEIGGFSGDATPSVNLLASACDYLVVNPNSVTASDLYYASDNVLYVEGNLICHLLLGHTTLIPEPQSKIGVIIEKCEEKFLNGILNAINAVRTVGGINIDPVVVTSGPIKTECVFSHHGHASGKFEGIEQLMEALDVIAKTDTTAVAFSTTLSVPEEIKRRYFQGEIMPNPWGGAEAILTHMATNFYPFTTAHSPVSVSMDDMDDSVYYTLGDPRDGAELISSAFLCSTLKGLTHSPRLQKFDTPLPSGCQGISVENVSAVVMPESTVGNIPFFAALEQNIPVILVRENYTQYEVTPSILGINQSQQQIYYVNSYMEATGLLLALKNGIAPEATTRPMPQIRPIYL